MAEGFEGGPIKRIGFLLVPDFSMLPFSAAVEPLRVANRLTRCPLYEWQLYSVDGQPVTASNTIPVAVDQGLDPFPRPELALVCAGLGCQRFEAPLALKWLRTLAREGLGVGGISSGSHILGRAGLLAGYRCTIHWEDRVSFRETFPGMLDTDGVFEIDRNRYTCSGGTAALDLMLNVISEDHGRELATAVADQFIHDRMRTSTDRQRGAQERELALRSYKLIEAIRLMEANLEEPLSPGEIAAYVDISIRQLERLFLKYQGCQPRTYYQRLRLQHARWLLLKTALSASEVALAAGFASPSHFSKCYRQQFGCTPSADRRGELGIAAKGPAASPSRLDRPSGIPRSV